MIDLNDVWQPPVHFDLPDIRRRLEASAPDWLPGLFPQARIAADRKSLRCADLSGRAPRGEGSCVIHLKGPYAGTGYDHATGEFAGGIDLIHHATGLLASPRASRRRLPHIGSSVFPYGRGCPLTAFAAGSGLRV